MENPKLARHRFIQKSRPASFPISKRVEWSHDRPRSPHGLPILFKKHPVTMKSLNSLSYKLAIFLAIPTIIRALPATSAGFDTLSSPININKDLTTPPDDHTNNTFALPKDTDPTPGSSCIRALTRSPVFHVRMFIWTVIIPGQMLPSTQGSGSWGGGLLDNLRGQCGDISLWTVNLDGVKAPDTGIWALFYSATCTLQQVRMAVWMASNADNRINVECEWPHGGSKIIVEGVLDTNKTHILGTALGTSTDGADASNSTADA